MRALFDSGWPGTVFGTLLIEGLVLAVWCRAEKRPCKNLALAFVPLNLLTQGMLLAALVFSPLPYWGTLLPMEALILFIEAVGYHLAGRESFPFRDALKLSLLCNAASFLLGLLLPF